ncbi:MAG: hypothetical protein IT439_11595 [Phycisphaerales bacterium]|nr:hypothetical protein [Phycisphaerales bacterium]
MTAAMVATTALATADPPEEEGEGELEAVAIEGVYEIPGTGPLAIYRDAQGPLIDTAFCTSNYDGLAIFEISDSAIDSADDVGGSTSLGVVVWTTYFSSLYSTDDLDPNHPAVSFFEDHDVAAALLIGRLEGTCDEVSCIAFAFDWTDDQDVRHHILIPLAEVLTETAAIALEFGGYQGPGAWQVDPCLDSSECLDLRERRIADALSAYAQCLKGLVPPVSLWHVGCFVLCAPFLAGTPAAYLTCLAACLAGVTVAPIPINLWECEQQLAFDKENADAGYCACLSYRAQNCPTGETDQLGFCP